MDNVAAICRKETCKTFWIMNFTKLFIGLKIETGLVIHLPQLWNNDDTQCETEQCMWSSDSMC